MLSPDVVDKFRDLYLREFGIKLTIEEAIEQAERFLKGSRVVLQPMPTRMLPRYKELLKEQELAQAALTKTVSSENATPRKKVEKIPKP